MANFQSINTRGISLDEALPLCQAAESSRNFSSTLDGLTVGMSSGTSGSRGVFLVSNRERAIWSGNILAKTITGSIFQKCRIALFLRNNSNLYETVSQGNIQFCYFDLGADCAANTQKLLHFQPDILVAPPSMLCYLAEQISRGRINLGNYKPAKVISAAEVLETIDRELITAAFGTEPSQIYQCTEGFLAYTCASGSLHLCEDLAVFERQYLACEAGKFVPVITDFTRTTQPIIRYWLGDILSDGLVCDCGSVYATIGGIVGRMEDCLLLVAAATENNSASETLVRILPDSVSQIFSDLGCSFGAAVDYRVIQVEKNTLVVSLPLEWLHGPVQAEIAKRLNQLCQSRGAVVPTLLFEALQPQESLAIKRRRVQRVANVN